MPRPTSRKLTSRFACFRLLACLRRTEGYPQQVPILALVPISGLAQKVLEPGPILAAARPKNGLPLVPKTGPNRFYRFYRFERESSARRRPQIERRSAYPPVAPLPSPRRLRRRPETHRFSPPPRQRCAPPGGGKVAPLGAGAPVGPPRPVHHRPASWPRMRPAQVVSI